jgi:aspartyl-tRNA(Asn)/glutamyl-tRNA(Gln) amidotransferase subunit C
MSLNKTDIEKIAHLARISLSEQDIPNYTHDLSNIINLVEQMNTVDSNDITPMAHPLDVHARMRIDTVTETNNRDNFQSIAPQTEAGLYLVPKVID